MVLTKEFIYELLEEVKDPEIPVLSLVDMGIIRDIQFNEGSEVTIVLTPTFVGCPALDMMKSDIAALLKEKHIQLKEIIVSFREPWSSDFISEKGKQALRKYGLAPPPHTSLFTDLDILEHAECPRCGGTETELRSPFGPTLCRSIHYCLKCREAFEQFKPL